MSNLTTRLTRRCVPGVYRMPMITEQEAFVIEVDSDDTTTMREQRNRSIHNAYFGDAINMLGEYEDLGYTPQELRELLKKFDS